MATTESTTAPTPKSVAPERGLNLDKAVEIFSRTLGADGTPDLSHIYEYYHPNMRFQDCIQVIHGREEFMEMSDRLARRCSELHMTVNDAAQNGRVIFLQWTMSMRFKNTPMTPLNGTTKLTLDEDGLITEHRDYFDLWGDTLDATPIGKAYRRVMRKLFG